MQLRRPSIIKALKLTKEQRRKINKLRREARQKLSEFLDEKDREGLSDKFAKLRAATKKKVMAILTAKQKEKIREMVGEEFKGKFIFEKLEAKSKDK
jgi:Spy/CpxP family protein refolding chaperone